MAVLGQALTAPEAGWKRYDDTHPAIVKKGVWDKSTNSFLYNGGHSYSNTLGASVEFKFIGTKLRLIAYTAGAYNTSVEITIDGTTTTYAQNTPDAVYQTLVFGKENLDSGVHVVKIKNPTTLNISFDAIDIDSTGRLLHPDEVTDPKDLAVGKRIRCNYKSATTGTVGTFSGLGQETKDFIPVASSATPDGDFYYIMVEDSNGIKKLIADRNLQSNISWDTLNTAGIASGSGLPTLFKLTGSGVSFGEYTPTLEPKNAFDGDTSTRFCSNSNVGELGYEFTSAQIVEKYTVSARSEGSINGSPKNWSFEAWDGFKWIVLDNQVGYTTWSLGEKKSFPILNRNAYSKYRINVSDTVLSSTFFTVSEIELLGSLPDLSFTTRLLTGGTASTDKDSEWDKYIVNSTLGGAITAGDNNVWNWSGKYSWTSTSTATNTSRMVKGYTAVDTTNSYISSNTSVVFRPVLLIESIFVQLNKSFILSNDKYKIYKTSIEPKKMEKDNSYTEIGTISTVNIIIKDMKNIEVK